MSSAQALLDILRLLNAQDFKRAAGKHESADNRWLFPDDGPLAIAGDAIIANYATLRLSSLFQPIIAHTFESIGYKAKLNAASARERNYNFSVSKLLWPGDREEIIYLDRLTRTLHALNYLAADLKGELHVSVNPQHLLEVHENHGAVFEQILSKCGLQPNRIVLEISEYLISNKRHLQNAIDAWRRRDYKIAIDGIGVDEAQLSRIVNLKPDIVKINGDFIQQFGARTGNFERIFDIVEQCRNQGIAVIATDIESAALYELVQPQAFSALQGTWLTHANAVADHYAKKGFRSTLFERNTVR